MPTGDEEVQRGAAVYSRRVLSFYDLFVVHLSNTVAWRCHRNCMTALYDELMGARHLDVGPGTGWYLAHARRPVDGQVTLMDLNANSLESARARLAESQPSTVVADVLEPLPDGLGPFDSIGANYLFHCVPGTWAEKGIAFGQLAERLAPGGAVFGGTILGRGVHHNAVGRRLMAIYNDKGIFHNDEDDLAGLERVLGEHFADVAVEVVGTVALFRGRRPIAVAR